jgi:diguanylate cyclase (GGDEF)-like protein/PAS domain S-box-containing protein
MPSLSLYEFVFNSSPIGNYLLSPTPEATILAVNDAFLNASSRQREDLLGVSVFSAFPGNPDDPDDTGETALRNSLARVIATGQPTTLPAQRYPIRVATPEGEERYEERFWSAVNTPIFDQDGQLLCISHATIDITKQIQVEAARRKSEAQYRGLFESMIEGFCIVEMLFDEHGEPIDFRFCEVNPIFEAQTGLHDVVGKTMRELAPLHEAFWFYMFGKVAQTGEPVRFESEAKALKRWIDVSAFRTDEPDAGKVAILFRDITEQKRAEEDLRRSERQALEAARQAEAERRRLNAVLEAAPVGIVVADANGVLVQANPANRSLWGENHPLSKSADEYRDWKGWWADGTERHGRRVEPHEWTLARVLRGEGAQGDIIEIESFETPPVHRIILNSAAPIKDGDGRVIGGVVALMDITDRIRAEASQRDTAERLQFTLDSAKIGDWEFDLVTGMTHRSLRHDQCFGYNEPLADWGFEKFIEHVHPDDRKWVREDFAAVIRGVNDWHFECRVIWPDGSLHWIAVHGSVYGACGRATRMTGIIYDITDRRQAEEELRHASLHDPLTGLPNRAMLFEYASHLLPHNQRNNQRAAVLFLDLDRFKPINDTHGHEVGDAVLKEVAGRLSRSVRAEDVATRLGGDEFVILLQHVRSATYATEVTRHIVAKISEPYRIGDLALSLSTSVGISIFPGDGQDIDTLISHADMAMYQAKQAGRNNFQFYSPEFAAGTRQQIAIEEQLKLALRTDAFHLCYQPVLDVETGDVVSVEALLRWQNAAIGPDRFVPVAEAIGIINPIGRWLQEEASRQHKMWIDHGLPPIPVAVNVSVVEFRDKNFVARFESNLRKHGIDTSALQLELTETAVMDEVGHAVTALSQLRELGVKVLLDDFGTGHSSLAYLARLPLNKIKIDKSFITRLECDMSSRVVADAMIALGRTLNLEVVAEGIESAGVLDYLCSHGCKQAQGFYLGRPMSPDSFESWYWAHGQTKGIGGNVVQRH